MNHKINFDSATFKEFENIADLDMFKTAEYFHECAFCEIKLNDEGFESIHSSIKDILNWAYDKD